MENHYNHAKFIISRFDHYYDCVNSKANFYLTFNTVIIAGLVPSYFFITKHFQTGVIEQYLFILIGIVSVISIISTLLAVYPFLNSGNSHKYKSLLFFESIVKMKEKEFVEDFTAQKLEQQIEDMTYQAYQLARGLNAKYQKLKFSGWLIAISLIVMFVTAILLITK